MSTQLQVTPNYPNAAALFPDLVGESHPKDVFQVLLILHGHDWNALLVYGVPRVHSTLVQAASSTTWGNATRALEKLLWTTAQALASTRPELGISRRSQRHQGYGIVNRDYL
ncbi:hypothetical protein CBER1_08253 [Cercospora berteroae]|uniref:Uncharacterized protein n=1 Tax=Cercospora berteroae TaxID=357750 RepID=A0A2S6CEW8_9PEZI|nr:hypothetical protein CBER1_08253 [Cercospora berteroae]